MVADLLLGSKPALHDVALCAIRAELPQMDVGMAIRAILADIGENRLGMTLRARGSFVPPSKRKLRPIVVKLRNIANWAPPGSRMAILARFHYRAVWVWSCAALSKKIRCMSCKNQCAAQKFNDYSSQWPGPPKFFILLQCTQGGHLHF